MAKYEYNISWEALFRITSTIAAVYLMVNLYKTILMILVSAMLAAAFYPLVKSLSKKIPMTLASVIVVLALFVPIIMIFFTIIPSLVEELPDLVNQVDAVFKNSALLPPALRNVDFSQYTQNFGNYLLQSTSKITGYVTAFLSILFLTLYMLIDHMRLSKIILTLIPESHKHKTEQLVTDLIRINGQYIRGNLVISLVCGFVIFIGLVVLNVPYAAPLALFAALTDLLPQIGAFIGAIPSIIIAFTVSTTIGLLVVGLFIIYQQIENNVLSPSIYNKALDLSPALSFIAVLVGAALGGITGAFIALPIAASIPTIVKYVQN